MNEREEVLAKALEVITKDRNTDYGEPEDNFKDIAAFWEIYLRDNNERITGTDVAVMCILIKIARLKQSPEKIDHWIDIAGYAACGYQCEKKMNADDDSVIAPVFVCKTCRANVYSTENHKALTGHNIFEKQL